MKAATKEAKSKTHRAGGPLAPGVIRADELYTREELLRRLRWQRGAFSAAIRAGLVTVRVGRSTVVFGHDLLDYFDRLRSQQHRS